MGAGGQVASTETAKLADTHVFIRPDTDVFFYRSFAHLVLAQGAIDAARVAAHMKGLAAVRTLVAAWPPERTESLTGISASVLRDLVARYIAASKRGGAALYCLTGVNMGRNGSPSYWLHIFGSETGALADYQLPYTSPLERADLPFLFPFMLGMQSRPYLQATRAVVPHPGRPATRRRSTSSCVERRGGRCSAVASLSVRWS